MSTSDRGGYWANTKGGNVPGYTALLAFVPELDLTLAMALNGDSSGEANQRTIGAQILRALLPALNATLTTGYRPVDSGPESAVSRVVGRYDSPPFSVQVTGVEGSLEGLACKFYLGSELEMAFTLTYSTTLSAASAVVYQTTVRAPPPLLRGPRTRPPCRPCLPIARSPHRSQASASSRRRVPASEHKEASR